MTDYNLNGTAIEEIKELVLEANAVIEPTAERQGVYFLRDKDGNLVKHEADLAFQNFTVLDLDSLTRAGKDAVDAGYAHTLFVHDDAAVLMNETASERWTATLPLPTHPAFKLLTEWKKPTEISQKELVRVLRTQLSHYVDATVIPTFSSLRMTSSSDGISSVAPSSNAINRNIVRQVQADQGRDVPEYILFKVPVYDIPEDRHQQYEVKVYVEFDHDKEKFVLVTVHDDLRVAREQAVARIIANLRGTFDGAVPTLYGQPK